MDDAVFTDSNVLVQIHSTLESGAIADDAPVSNSAVITNPDVGSDLDILINRGGFGNMSHWRIGRFGKEFQESDYREVRALNRDDCGRGFSWGEFEFGVYHYAPRL